MKRGPKPKPLKCCAFEGCERKAVARGWCNTHWARWRRIGDVNYEKPMHRLSEIDTKSKRAICALCGPVDIRWRKNPPIWECLERVRAGSRRYRAQGKTKWLHNNDGTFTRVERNILAKLWFRQNGKCAGCGISLASLARHNRHLDHSHDTKTVRGILCMNCNAILGHAKDNPETLKALIKYLEKTQ